MKWCWPVPQVLHVPDIDWQTVSITFRDALTAVKNWSTANPDHTPLAFYVEIKNVSTDTVASVVGSANVQKINTLLGSEPGGPPYECVACHARGRCAAATLCYSTFSLCFVPLFKLPADY